MQHNSIKELWNSFKTMRYSDKIGNYSVAQLRESEKIFYVSAMMLLNHFREDVGDISDEDEAVAHMNKLQEEVSEFIEAIPDDVQ